MSPTRQDQESLAIETRGLRKQYGDVVAVGDLDLAIEDGVVYGFLGPNGSGRRRCGCSRR